MFTQSKLLAALLGSAICSTQLFGNFILTDSFDYPNGPLSGQGTWARGTNTPTSDNPSNHIVVNNGAVRFDWTTATPINNSVRSLWGTEAAVTADTIYAIFSFTALQAPQAAADVRPGFFSFGDGAGNQQRGFVGLQAGSTADSVQLGISQSSQLGGNFVFSSIDLALNTTYTVMVGFDAATQETSLWIGSVSPITTPDITIAGGGTNNGIRRVNLRMYNNDGGTGVTNLGIFEIDNLTITTIPEPRVYAALTGLLALGLVLFAPSSLIAHDHNSLKLITA
ncbi:MAG: hypothetical protein LR015_08845 [Verrucomicrobia bacterium]|nr:hypothetical protein [Verrucomicrobiota bacterium]